MINPRGPLGVKGLDEIRIKGGRPLKGAVSIQGSKNAALPMMAASLLHRGISILRACPRIADVFCMEEILKFLGARTWWVGHDLYLDCSAADGSEIPAIYTERMRSSVILLGVLLARNGRGCLGYPGGCVIGRRPVDFHMEALKSLGAELTEEEFFICAVCGRLQGSEIRFCKKSVGATEQAILASVLAEGETRIVNAALEPEIICLCRYLEKMGARISGAGQDAITVRGVKALGAGDMQVPADRIVAGTYLCACAATRGNIIIENPPIEELGAFLEVYRKIGGQFKRNSGKLIADASKVAYPLDYLETEEYPGFPTDLQSPLMAVLATIPGESHIRESIFEDRFKIADGLQHMGARIRISGRDAWIKGTGSLKGCPVHARELRGGAALVLAGLAAEGETVIEGYSFIRRGYEHICEDLGALGASIKSTGK